jgi:hypothetical protein
MHSVSLYIRPQLFAQRFVSDQIDRAFKKVFKIKLRAKILLGASRARERNQHIHVASLTRCATRSRAKQRQTAHTKLLLQMRFVRSKEV